MKWIVALAMLVLSLLVSSLTPDIASARETDGVTRVAKHNARHPENGAVLPPFYRDVEGHGSGSAIAGGGCRSCGFAGDCSCEFQPSCWDNIWGGYCGSRRCGPRACGPIDDGIPLGSMFGCGTGLGCGPSLGCGFGLRNLSANACGASRCGSFASLFETPCAVDLPVCAAAPAGCGIFGNGCGGGCGHGFCLHRMRGAGLFSGGCRPCGGGLANLFQCGQGRSAMHEGDCGCAGDDGCSASVGTGIPSSCDGSGDGVFSAPSQAAPAMPVGVGAPVEMMPTPAYPPTTSRPTAMPSPRSAKRPVPARYPLPGAKGR